MKVLSIITPSNKEFDTTINKILQGSEYKHLKNNLLDFITKIKESISQWIVKIIKKTISNIPSPDSVSNNLANILIIIGLLLIFVIVVIIIVKVCKTFERKSRIKEILGEKISNKTTPSSLRSTAKVFGEKGDFREAIRYDFIAILLLMHEKNIIYLDETKTNEEIYQYLKKNKFTIFSIFEYIINDFNSSWYGHKVYNRETYDKALKSINLIWNEVIAYEEKNK
ncbi:hypothetical protein G9F72_012910 [Clostridium estertheticum]|uniref:hypothetical protein n=1 Tax=Clostridium estertheticum TaxID=238834 RepID=UPI0013E91534|nr:hypothetical protein [Clostridium estertheticum]MBZ9687226.1 hypothetical protein [Clostridium estertheticum]